MRSSPRLPSSKDPHWCGVVLLGRLSRLQAQRKTNQILGPSNNVNGCRSRVPPHQKSASRSGASSYPPGRFCSCVVDWIKRATTAPPPCALGWQPQSEFKTSLSSGISFTRVTVGTWEVPSYPGLWRHHHRQLYHTAEEGSISGNQDKLKLYLSNLVLT